MPSLATIYKALQIIFTLIQQIISGQQAQASADALNTVHIDAAAIRANVGEPGILDETVFQRLTDLETIINADQAALLAAIAACAQTGDPVVLPAIPPIGYGGMDASGFMAIHVPVGDYSGAYAIMSDLMSMLYKRQYEMESSSIYDGQSSASLFRTKARELGTVESIIIFPFLVDWTLLATAPHLMDFIEAQGWSYSFHGQDGLNNLYIVTTDDSGDVQWNCTIAEPQYQVLRANLLASQSVAPVWPGLAGVTLGVPVAISAAFTITAPMHGVIVALTGEPTKSSFFSFDGVNSYRNLGALSFTTDDGEQEFSQSLGFTAGIYTPRVMAKASGVKVRAVGGVTGTVTPWVIV